jgi:hypothetical protein
MTSARPKIRTLILALPAVALSLAAFVTPASAAPVSSWSPSLSTADGPGSSNVTTSGGVVRLGDRVGARDNVRTGLLELAPHRLIRATNSVSAKVDSVVPSAAELAVDVRGIRPDGRWSEWIEARPDAPAVLPSETTTVQARLVLTAPDRATGPEVRRLSLTATKVVSTADVHASALSYRVYATREGLVGGTTANGHVIRSRDHFVALPSRRGLSANGSHTYSVRVCAASGRCETAPVWDVGPWNTTDDYWNPSSTRQSWKNLAQGTPEAQAAYQSGYNGGKDQFGRKVANPAGIDLADGTFWDGLGLTNNAWVTVTYLWT